MPFELSPAEEMARKIAQDYAERYIIPRRKELMIDDRAMWEEEAVRQNKFGFHLHIVPRSEGGTGIGYVASIISIEELCAAWPDLQFVTYGEMAYYFAKATGGAVEKKFMPGIIKGDIKATAVVTEPSGGSDMLGLRSTARKVDGGWVLNGRKCFISEAQCTDFIMTLMKTGDPSDPATRGTRSLSAFIVEKGMPGYRMGRAETTLGRKEDLWELIFDNCFVPDSNLVGQVGRGTYPVFAAVADTGRMTIFGMLNGITLGAYRCSVKYAKERKLYGRSISEHQAIQHRIADMAIDLEAARLLTYRAGAMRTKGLKVEGELAIAKYFSTQAAFRAAINAVHIHGAYGVMEDYMPHHYYKHVPLRIGAGGTDELMKNMIAAACLKDANPDLSSKLMEESYFGAW
jgi:alkylation response protein AidB-like acyl-CoA dehydrogenase